VERSAVVVVVFIFLSLLLIIDYWSKDSKESASCYLRWLFLWQNRRYIYVVWISL